MILYHSGDPSFGRVTPCNPEVCLGERADIMMTYASQTPRLQHRFLRVYEARLAKAEKKCKSQTRKEPS